MSTRTPYALRPVALAAALSMAALAHAQSQGGGTGTTEADAASSDGLRLDQILITGNSTMRSKMRSSVAVSTIEAEGVVTATATSAADILRSVPGLRSESSGGESNANVGVRGIPISAGGARYIQFQEDGLPVLQFGDIAFATADTWIRADASLERLEVVRGGSASTLATGAPGGIINYISKTGLEAGGTFAQTIGIGAEQTRTEVGYGGRLAPKVRYWIGGFFREGDGGRDGATGTEDGGQIRGNITFELPNSGYVRFSAKHLDDHSPTFLPTPVRYVNGRIEAIPGMDPRRTAFYNAGWPLDNTLTASNGREVSNIRNGLSAKSDSFGSDIDLDAGGGFRLQNRLSWSRNSGRFIGIFPGDDVAAAPAGTTIASGPGAGQFYTGDKFTAVVFNTKVDDAGLAADDLRFTKAFALDGAKLNVVGGLYTSVQHLKLTWNFNQYSLSASESGALLLNVPGVVNGSPGFGGCCMNTQDSKYTTRSPYAVLNFDVGPLTGDVSVRHDSQRAAGTYYQTLTAFGGAANGTAYDLTAPRIIDYKLSRTSYSAGANYSLGKDLSLFGRISDGAAYNADRITFFNDARLVNGASSVIPVNKVRQLEGGAKWRSGGMSLFATAFFAKTDEVNVDLTTTPIRVTNNKYDSKGLELEGAMRMGAFSLLAGATYTSAEITESSNAALVGQAPKRQAKLVYQLTPTARLGELTVGAGIVGTSSSQDDGPGGPLTITLPAYTMVNAYAAYAITANATVQLAANNLFDTLAYTESNDGRGAARAHTGRTVKATLRYTF
jgi:outer membrane receptor protein involved in Fe transport